MSMSFIQLIIWIDRWSVFAFTSRIGLCGRSLRCVVVRLCRRSARSLVSSETTTSICDHFMKCLHVARKEAKHTQFNEKMSLDSKMLEHMNAHLLKGEAIVNCIHGCVCLWSETLPNVGKLRGSIYWTNFQMIFLHEEVFFSIFFIIKRDIVYLNFLFYESK